MAKTYLSRWSIVFGTVLLAVLGSYQGTDASPSSPFELQPATGVPGATVSIVGKGLGRFKSAQVNRVLFGGVPALIQRWDSDVVEVKVPFSTDRSGSGADRQEETRGRYFSVVHPKIVSIHPPAIEPGHAIEIVGEHFGITAGPRDPNTMFGVNDVIWGTWWLGRDAGRTTKSKWTCRPMRRLETSRFAWLLPILCQTDPVARRFNIPSATPYR